MKKQAVHAPAANRLQGNWFGLLIVAMLILLVATVVLVSRCPGVRSDAESIVTRGKPGPWGILESAPIRLEASESFIRADFCVTTPFVWRFLESDPAQVRDLLSKARVARDLAESLMDQISCAGDQGCVISPTIDQIQRLTPRNREALYPIFGASHENPWVLNSMRESPARFEQAISMLGLTGDTLELARSLVFDLEGDKVLVDIAPICTRLSSEGKRRFIRGFYAVDARLVKLRVDPDSDINAMERYWSGGWRSKDVGPILESLHRSPQGITIDVIHLIPSLARSLLNTFPDPRGPAYNCHWTSLNFFAQVPDDRYLRDGEANRTINEQFRQINDGRLRLGDVLLFVREDGEAIHSANYIADDIVFTKNGVAEIEPWVLVSIDEVMRVYSVAGKLHVQPMRRKAD